MAKNSWWKRAVGEMSHLRQKFTNALGWNIITGGIGGTYKLDTSRVDYKLARQLYKNTNDNYKLGAGFAKPIINTSVAFMGVPRFVSEDENAQEVLDNFFGLDNVSKMQRTHRNSMRDGDWFVWVTREEERDAELYPEINGARLIYNMIPPEMVKHVIRDPITGDPIEYIIESKNEWVDDGGNKKSATITQRISSERRFVSFEGDTPPDLETGEITNSWGFIPIVHFMNESDDTEAFGESDLEAIEPFIKAYHDVMLHAIQGSKMHSTPRLKLKLKDVAAFMKNNFGVSDPAKFASEGKTITLEGHELLLFSADDDAEFIEVKSATGDAAVLLKFLFYCIVDTSETPEFVFGVHTPSSLSSVKEQMPILIRRIARKREQFTESWQRLARIVLAMSSQAENKSISTYETTIEWDDIDPRDGKDVAEELKAVATALKTAIDGGFISNESAVNFFAQYVNTMEAYESDDQEIPGERERIMKMRLMDMRLEDGQFLDSQKQKIDEMLQRLAK
jgi:hypothetical protein